jgi:hypothetical protein
LYATQPQRAGRAPNEAAAKPVELSAEGITQSSAAAIVLALANVEPRAPPGDRPHPARRDQRSRAGARSARRRRGVRAASAGADSYRSSSFAGSRFGRYGPDVQRLAAAM